MHAQGVSANKTKEADLFIGVAPNSSYTYQWAVPITMQPSKLDWPCIAWLYSSSVDHFKDMYSGEWFGNLFLTS